VAREHGVNANHVFQWRHEYRKGILPPRAKEARAELLPAWWFFIVVAAYIWIWMVTQDRDSLTNGALVLMGISAATGLGAVLVDSSKDDQRQPLVKEQIELNKRLADLSTQIAANLPPPNLDDLKAEQKQKAARLEEVKTALASLPSPPRPSEVFFA
jgi:hypothetical protein